MLPPKLIMAPVDFSEHSQEALGTATDLAALFGAELCAVHVVPAIPKLPSASAFFKEREYEDALYQDAGKRLEEMTAAAAQRGVRVRTVVGVANDVSGELLRIAEHNNVDLIIIATHGMGGWRKLTVGSVTEKVVRLAACPVLVLRVRAESAQNKTELGSSVAIAH